MSRTAIGVLLLVGTAGCGPLRPGPEPAAPPAMTPADRETAQDLFGRRPLDPETLPEGTTVLQLHVHVWRFHVPRLDATQQARLFQHLDEHRIPAEQLQTLKANGLRMAVGDGQSWPVVRAALMEHHPVPHEQSVVSESGRPLKIELAALPGDEALFVFGADGQLHGDRIAAGVLCWHVEHALDLQDVRQLRLRLIPEVLVGERIGGSWTTGMAPPQEVLRFEALRADVVLEPEHYLVVGPSDRPRLDHLLGSRYVGGQRDGLPFDVYYCLVPRLVQRTIAPRS